jgi:hypothetical protein
VLIEKTIPPAGIVEEGLGQVRMGGDPEVV